MWSPEDSKESRLARNYPSLYIPSSSRLTGGTNKSQVSSGDRPEADVLCLRYMGVEFRERFPLRSIIEGKLQVSDIYERARLIFDNSGRLRVSLSYNGRELREDSTPIRDYGVCHNSKLVLAALEASDEEDLKNWSRTLLQSQKVGDDRRKETQTVGEPPSWIRSPKSKANQETEPDSAGSSSSNWTWVSRWRTTGEQLADLLFHTEGLGTLYREAVEALGVDEFYEKHDRLLEGYLRELRISTQDKTQLIVIWALSSVLQIRRVTQCIVHFADSTASQTGFTKARVNSMSESESESCVSEDGRLTDPFFTSGKPLGILRAQVRCLVRAPATIYEALWHEDAILLEMFLDENFDEAAKDEYAWISDIKEVGYTNGEISELLYERAHDSPWIFFEPSGIKMQAAMPGRHLEGCAHNLVAFTRHDKQQDSHSWQAAMQTDQDREVRRTIEELCGIGGVVSYTRRKQHWNGSARFAHGNSTAYISYYLMGSREAAGTAPSRVATIRRLIQVCERFCTALRVVQDAGYCCDSFTILQHSPAPFLYISDRNTVDLIKIRFKTATRVLGVLKRIENAFRRTRDPRDVSPSDYMTDVGTLTDVLGVFWGATVSFGLTLDHFISSLALALQVYCVGFLSYAQAHLGPIQPFFLDTPLQRIVLLGTADLESTLDSTPKIIASLTTLSCLDGMTKGPVMAFRTPASENFQPPCDVFAAPADLLDTWGPGHLVFPPSSPQSPVAIRIGRGYISPPAPGISKHHWDTVLRLPVAPLKLQMTKLIHIGGLIKINSKCKNDEGNCWRASSGAFEELGTHQAYNSVAEYQLGFQAGPDHFAITTNKIWQKRRGRTIKERNLECDDHMLVPFLDFYWGVRVSYCTGIAQRVQLRDLVADMLPAFAETLTSMTAIARWGDLSATYKAIEAFRTPNSKTQTSGSQSLHGWLRSLPEDLHRLTLGLIRQILQTLKHTGLSPDGTHFAVAWPHAGIVNRCFRIPLDDCSKWTPMLADSDDCATFAYITTAWCLEADRFACRGPDPPWENKLYLLETAVLCPHAAPTSTGTWTLGNGQTYFFRKLDDNLFWVKARREAGGGNASGSEAAGASQATSSPPAMLVRLVFAEALPLDVRQRLLFWEERKKERRLREKDLEVVKAEVVGILSNKY